MLDRLLQLLQLVLGTGHLNEQLTVSPLQLFVLVGDFLDSIIPGQSLQSLQVCFESLVLVNHGGHTRQLHLEHLILLVRVIIPLFRELTSKRRIL